MKVQGKLAAESGKFDAKAIPVAFLGFNPLGDGCTVMDPESHNMYVSRHLTFLDNDFSAMHNCKLRDSINIIEPSYKSTETDEAFFGSLSERNESDLAVELVREYERLERAPAEEELSAPPRRGRSKTRELPASKGCAKSAAPAAVPKAQEESGRYPKRARSTARRFGIVDYERDVIMPKEAIALALMASKLTGRKQRVHLRPASATQRAACEEAKSDYTTNKPLDLSEPRHYTRGGEIRMPSQQCIADNQHGGQCNLRTCRGALCWIHLKKQSNLRVAPSELLGAGRGLWVPKGSTIKSGDMICEYTGDLVHTDIPEVVEATAKSNYLGSLSKKLLVDAARTNTAPGRFANAPRGSGKSTNATWRRTRDGKLKLFATEDLIGPREVLIGYGSSYWQKHAAAAKGREASAHSAKAEFGPEPKSFKEAQQSVEWPQWKKAAAEEQQSLRDYKVYAIVERGQLPKDAHILTAKWVFKRKVDGNGVVKRHKARVVGRGYTQLEGVHYDQTMANVMQLKSARILIALANELGYEMNLMGFHTAYLNADLDKEIFLKALDGFTGPEAGRVLKLLKALYGLKQSGRLWNETLVKALKALGYKPLDYIDPCIMVKTSKTGRTIIIGTYVDDMPHLWHLDDDAEMKADKASLCKQFEIADLGPMSDFLGIKIERDRKAGATFIHQRGYATEICEQFGFNPATARKETTPEFMGDPSSTSTRTSQTGEVTVENFRKVVGCLSYLSRCTRPDIEHAVNILARAQSDPQPADILRAKRVLRYVAFTVGKGIKYTRQEKFKFPAIFVDSDWAGDKTDARSITNFVSFFGGAALTWVTQKQTTVAQSSSEAEYIAANVAGTEIVWLRNLFAGLGFPRRRPRR